MSNEQSLSRMKVQVKYHGKEPTLVRPYPNLPKIDVQPEQVVEVDVTVANVLRRIPLWSVVGEPEKFNRDEEEKLQTHLAEVREAEHLQKEKDAGAKPEVPAEPEAPVPPAPSEGGEGSEGGAEGSSQE